jgi:hypothetical protein
VFCVEYTELTVNTTDQKGNTNKDYPPPGYDQGMHYVVNLVGSEVAKFIQSLGENGFISGLKDIHIIGHSLGAHTAGGIGRHVMQLNNFTQKVGRITGLDPGNIAMLFDEFGVDLDVILNPFFADFVDVYHTHSLPVTGLGQKGKLGHVDFYPDGGEIQKACDGQDCKYTPWALILRP